MSDHFENLLNATVEHLQSIKAGGTRFVSIAPETLLELSQPAPQKFFTAAEPAPAHAEETSPVIEKILVSKSQIAPEEIAATTSPSASAFTPHATPKDEAKEAAMADLRERALACQKCPNLARTRKNVVFGVGDIYSPLMFVGEAPGADEDLQGEPFVGAAGQLLTKIIKAMGYSRETVYIANILKCRPDMPPGSSGNRKPTPDEMKTCLPYLLAQIDLIQPKVIVALGATAIEGLLGKGEGISKMRGTWKTFRDTPLMPTFHPAYLLRNQAPSEKRKVWEDMLQVLEKLGAPISEKQRGYFLHKAES